MAATATAKSKEQDVDNSAMGKFRMGRILGDKWRIVQKLDEGGFGSVYKVQNVQDPKLLAALKVEPSNTDEFNHLKLETAVLKDLHAKGCRAHVPQLFRSAKRRSYCYMIITLLGENLRRLKERVFPKGMPQRTWTRVGIQCLYGIKTMHDRGYVHRDIKPQNFVLGFAETPAYARVVYIIDFGLSRNFAFPPTAVTPKWIARRARSRLEFRGTYRYASPTMHDEKEQELEKKKLHMKDEDLMTKMPEGTKFIPKHLRSLNVYERPNYLKIYRALEKLRKASKTTYEDCYEWEGKEAAIANKKAMREKQAPIGYTNADVFFKSDPIGLKAAPSTKDEQLVNDRFVFKKTKPEMIVLEDVIALSVKPPPKPSPEKRSVETPPTTPKSPAPAVQQQQKERKKTSRRTASPASSEERRPKKTEQASTASKQAKPKRTSTSKKEGGSLEESDDFVPSCYMNFDIPLHYLQSPNEDAKEFQKKLVGMDWGHAEPPKQIFKEAFTPLKQQPVAAPAAVQQSVQQQQQQPPAAAATPSQTQLQLHQLPDQQSLLLQQQQQQQDSSGNSDSQGPPSNRSVGASPSAENLLAAAEKRSSTTTAAAASISPSCSASCIVPHHENDMATAQQQQHPQQPSSSSNNSISLTGPREYQPQKQPGAKKPT